MHTVSSKRIPLSLQILADQFGQDLIEYSLIVAFLAVAVGAITPEVNNQISQVYSKITSSMNAVGTSGS